MHNFMIPRMHAFHVGTWFWWNYEDLAWMFCNSIDFLCRFYVFFYLNLFTFVKITYGCETASLQQLVLLAMFWILSGTFCIDDSEWISITLFIIYDNCMLPSTPYLTIILFDTHWWSGKTTAIRRIAVRETSVSRNNGVPIEGHLKAPRTITALSYWKA